MNNELIIGFIKSLTNTTNEQFRPPDGKFEGTSSKHSLLLDGVIGVLALEDAGNLKNKTLNGYRKSG